MPAIVQVKVVAARDLPIMDRSSELTDAFVELKLGQAFEKTDVCAKTLNPVWDSKWFTFKMEEEDLQEEPLQVRMMDHDTYSAHNAIGKVYITLSSLGDKRTQNNGVLDGWFPIYDTLHGIRGEVRLIVKVEVLKDRHRFRQSSCGIMFFTCPQTPSEFSTHTIHGFVEELVVNDDPEYKWIDRIRTPRASNEARQRLFSKLTGELQRKIGLKTIEVGGNAVIGYQQYFDLEGDTGIVVRGIGTCVSIFHKLHTTHSTHSAGIHPIQLPANILAGSHSNRTEEYMEGLVSPKQRIVLRKTSSSDSDGPSSPTNRGSGITLDSTSKGGIHSNPNSSPHHTVSSSSDFPFYTLTSLPPGLLRRIGGIVSSRSVKLLDKIKDPDEPETRDVWWQEVRNEVRSHVQAIGCNAVIGYSESTSICDTLCIFSAIGTAVSIGPYSLYHLPKRLSPGSSGEEVKDAEKKETHDQIEVNSHPDCRVCHTPYSATLEGKFTNCSICNSGLVPAIILSTAEPPQDMIIRGCGTLVQVRVVLPKKRLKGDENATFISKQLPFLEYKLYTRLLNKVRIKGMNSVFCLQMQYTVGDTMVIGVATGTSVFLEALPPPSKLTISDKDKSSNAHQLASIQDALNRTQEENMKKHDLMQPMVPPTINTAEITVADEENQAGHELNLSSGLSGRSNVYVYEVEDHVMKEEDIMELILDKPLPKGFYVANTHLVPGLTPSSQNNQCQMITVVTKKTLEPGKQHLEKQCAQFLDGVQQALAFKARKVSPCLLTRIRYDIDLPEDDVLQISVTALLTRIGSSIQKSQSDEMIFLMEESSALNTNTQEANITDINMFDENKAGAVLITPLPYICGCHVERYLKIMNFFVIRESTSIRENGGLGSFMHLFTLEVLAIARAHVAAIGGNALLNFRLNDCVLIEHSHKNQAQCLLNISGDAAFVPSLSSTIAVEESSNPIVMEMMHLEDEEISNQRDTEEDLVKRISNPKKTSKK